jgi:hypothetical protein
MNGVWPACVVAVAAPVDLLVLCRVSADASAAIAMHAAGVTQNSSCFDLIRKNSSGVVLTGNIPATILNRL